MHLIYVMRHAQSVHNADKRISCRRPDGDLTELGREQALRAASALQDKNIGRILHSPFHRAEQTARIIGERLALPFTEDVDLGEINCGDLEWRSDDEGWADWFKMYERWMQGDWNARYPGGESYREGYDRFNRCLLSIDSEETVLIVTHGGICTTVIPYLCVNAAALQGQRILDHTGMIVLEPYGDGRFICRAWNQVDHL
ncbi:MAG: histidine phosphatase family protein [Anaerolineae bacterium]|nr:histidine phosphatase family protein [Anaerolineae bacterium]